MNYLQSIARNSADNLGGIMQLRVCPVAGIAAIPDPVDDTVYGDITFNAGYSWALWQVKSDDAGLRDRVKDSEEGLYSSYSLPFFIPGDRAGWKKLFDAMHDDAFIILAKDPNNNQVIVGSLDAPLRFKAEFDSGNNISGLRGYACEFFSDGGSPAYFYAGDVAAPVPDGSVAPAVVRKGDGTVLAVLQPGQIFTITSGFSFGFRIE